MKKQLILPVIIAINILVSGCSTGAMGESVVGRPGSPMWFNTASQPTIIQYYKSYCLNYGYQDGATGMAQCLQTEISNAKQRANDRLKNMNNNQTIHCTTFGNTTTCNSW